VLQLQQQQQRQRQAAAPASSSRGGIVPMPSASTALARRAARVLAVCGLANNDGGSTGGSGMGEAWAAHTVAALPQLPLSQAAELAAAVLERGGPVFGARVLRRAGLLPPPAAAAVAPAEVE
jgi:hypothetical protein